MSLQFNPGFYTKVRIDDSGQIVGVDELTKDDLPQHTHAIQDLNETELRSLIVDILSTFFANNGNCAVQFTFDENTRTVSADVNIDDETVYKNQYGQLASKGSEGVETSPQPNGGVITKDQLAEIQQSLMAEIELSLANIFSNNLDSAVIFNYDSETKTVSADLRYDNVSLIKDEHGDLIASGKTPGDGGPCASHSHTADQIEGLRDLIINVFNDYSQNLNLDLANYIDGVTIKINEYGQLVSVQSALEKHNHTLKDITDYVAADPAAVQPMSDLGEDVDYDSGVINFENLNIGYSILALSQYLKDVINKNLTIVNNKLDQFSVQNDNTGIALLSIGKKSTNNILFDKQSQSLKTVYYGPDVYLLLDFVPYESGDVILYDDKGEVCRAKIDDLRMEGDVAERFEVYTKYFKNKFLAKVLKVNINDLIRKDNSYRFQVAFKPTTETIDYANEVLFYATPNKSVPIEFEDITETHRFNNKDYYDNPCQYKYQLTLKDYENYRFINQNAGFNEGVLSGVSDQKAKTISIPNLFENTLVDLHFDLTPESSDSWLFDRLEDTVGGSIINDVIVPQGESCTCTFELPGSETFNSVKILGNLPRETLQVRKGKLIAKGTVKADTLQPGYIPTQGDYQLLTFAECYDPGRDKMYVDITTKTELNLSGVQMECLQI